MEMSQSYSSCIHVYPLTYNVLSVVQDPIILVEIYVNITYAIVTLPF